MTTVFTKIIDGQLPGRFVWADELCVAFLTIAPLAPGHTLVVTRDEVERFTAAEDTLLAHLATVAATIGRAQEQAWPSTRATVLVAGFEVPHLHVHVVPARSEADLSFARADHNPTPDALDAAATALRDVLTAEGHAAQVPVEMGSAEL
ncbi:MAG: HIT family protein [Micrococcales bacterium]|nr:HIT family protein [Micrococcales bacterium]MCL2668596.1 HIT family protein [Micrococcales bacterium]